MKLILLDTIEENSQHLLLDDRTPSWESSSGGKVSKEHHQRTSDRCRLRKDLKLEVVASHVPQARQEGRGSTSGKVKTQRIKIKQRVGSESLVQPDTGKSCRKGDPTPLTARDWALGNEPSPETHVLTELETI